MDDRIVFLLKLIIGTVLMALFLGWGMSFINISRPLLMQAMFLTLAIWGLWTLRRISR